MRFMCISKFHSKTIGFNDVEPYQIFEQTCSGHESRLLKTQCHFLGGFKFQQDVTKTTTAP
jgi:hypothetical protein